MFSSSSASSSPSSSCCASPRSYLEEEHHTNAPPSSSVLNVRVNQNSYQHGGGGGDRGESRSNNQRHRFKVVQPRDPVKAVDPDAMSSLIAKELTAMTLEEREAVYEDVHGISSKQQNTNLPQTATSAGSPLREDADLEEDEESIANLIESVKAELSKMRIKTAYDKAVFMCPTFVHDPKFMTMFLRSEDYDVKRTALRISSHFTFKLELFGLSKLVQRITLKDLNNDDMQVLESGCMHILPPCNKDTAGRTINFVIPKYFQDLDRKAINHVRVMWHLAMSAVEEDEEAQQNGFVLIRFSVAGEGNSEMNGDDRTTNYASSSSYTQLEYFRKASVLTKSIPLKVRAYHFCYDSEQLRPVMATIQYFLGKQRRVRFRAHYGSTMECLYALMGFGITKEMLPIDYLSGNLKSGYVQEFIQRQRSMEEQREKEDRQTLQSSGAILYPQLDDILLGRGRSYQEFPGNLRLATLIDELRSAYKAESRSEKIKMTNEVRLTVKNYGGRFLKKDGMVWVEVLEEPVIREKISHGFRTQTSRKRPAQNNAMADDNINLQDPTMEDATSMSKRQMSRRG